MAKVLTAWPDEDPEDNEEDLVRLYLTDIGQYALLTSEDEVRLAQQIEIGVEARARLECPDTELTASQKGDLRRKRRKGEQAERTFVQSNLRLVVSIAKKYQASGLPLLDLIQEGNLGLMHAVEKFDWRKGFKFSTYATWWIRQAITRGIANTGRTIRLPVHAGDTLARLQKARSRLERRLGRPATVRELAEEVEMPEEKVTEALRFAAEPLSLSDTLREDDDADSPFEVAATALLPEEISRLLSPLDDREREILKLRFGLDRGEPRTLEEVGEHFELTRERIRQIEARAMSKLRHPSSDTGAHVAEEPAEQPDEEDLLRLYLTDIGQYALLTSEDEVRLAQQIEIGVEARARLECPDTELTASQKGDLRRKRRKGEIAERTFVQSNLHLVVPIAITRKYQASGLPLLDRIQEGNLGLMHAVETFDWRKGFKFSTYATWLIRQAITRRIANTG